MRRILALALSALVGISFLSLAPAAATGQVTFVHHVFPGPNNYGEQAVVDMAGTLFFWADDGVHGVELFKSDGSDTGTVLVKDINPGSASSNPAPLTPVGSTLFFMADDGVHGRELWKSDGTEGGTVLVKDINPGWVGSTSWYTNQPNQLRTAAAVGNTFYFAANDGATGTELWRSDGTTVGTVLVHDLATGGSSDPQELTAMGGALYFRAYGGAVGSRLWRSDGTAAGTWPLTGTSTSVQPPDVSAIFCYPDNINSLDKLFYYCGVPVLPSAEIGMHDPAGLTAVGRELYFVASDRDHGSQLWKSDGTPIGTVRVSNIPSAYISAPTAVGGTLFLSVNEPTHGEELWKSDGTEAGTVLVKDIYPGNYNNDPGQPYSSNPRSITDFRGEAFFEAYDPVAGGELWKSDGTEAGTVIAADIAPGDYIGASGASFPNGSYPEFLTVFRGKLCFRARDDTYGAELWTSDGTADGTVRLTDLRAGPSPSWPENLTVSGDELFFSARADDHDGGGLWAYTP